MGDRVVHEVHSECDVYIEKVGSDVRIRITEKDPEILHPTDFEITGDTEHIAEALNLCVHILSNIAEYGKTPN